MRRLLLLGPVRVEPIQKIQSKATKNAAAEPLSEDLPKFRSRRTIGLLGYLVAERRPIARDLLATLFWPDWSPSRGRANLRRELHNLARILPGCWDSNRRAIAFAPSPDTVVDLDQLLQLEELERWEEAAEWLGGEFLEGLYLDQNPDFENWLLLERERWRRRAERILTHEIESHSRRGRYDVALSYARRLLQLTPWDEEVHMRLMRLLAWTGQRGAALRQFEICKATLLEELGVEPSPQAIALYQHICAGTLDLPPQLPAFLTDEKARRPYEQPLFVGRERELARLDGFLDAALTGQGRVIFITGGPGRGKTALLETFAQRAMTKHDNLLVASGKCHAYAGVGDPYLAYRDVMAMLTGDVEGRWDAGGITREHARRLWEAFPLVVLALLDYGPHLLDVLVPGKELLARAQVAAQGDTPWLSRLRGQVKQDGWATSEIEQSNLFQQFVNVLRNVARERPLLLILDDIQWADVASISLLFHLGRQLPAEEIRFLIACAYRPEEIAPDKGGNRHPLPKALSEFKRIFGDVWLNLAQTTEDEAWRFVNTLLDAQPNKLTGDFRRALFDRTGGHPLFTVELLRALQDRGHLVMDAGGMWIVEHELDWQLLPAQVEAVIEDRIDRLDPDLQDILAVASVEGELFTARVVAQVRDMAEKAALKLLSGDLERRHRLVVEQEEINTRKGWLARYRFVHVLFQVYLYRRLGQGERRRLHAGVAAALEDLHQGQIEDIAVQLAHHYQQAGASSQAFHYYALAADRAGRLHESREAIANYTRAIQLAGNVSPDAPALIRLYGGRGRACERLGDFEQAQSDHTIARQLAESLANEPLAWRAHLDLGRLWASRDYEHARVHFESALEIARRLNDETLLATSLNWIGNWHANAEHPYQAVESHREALAIFENLGDAPELAKTLDLLGMAQMLGGDLSTSIRTHDQAIALFRQPEDLPGLCTTLLGRASNSSMLVFLASLPPDPACDAIPDFDEALRIARSTGSLVDEAWVHWSLGLLHIVHGQFGQALTLLQRGVQIAADIGHREYLLCNQFSLGLLHVQLFDLVEAREQLETSRRLAAVLRSSHYTHLVGGAFAGACLAKNDPKAAQACLDEMFSSNTPMDTLGKRYCWTWLATLALEQGNPERALDITDRLIASAPGMSPGRVITYLWQLRGEALAATGRVEEARAHLLAAIENARASEERFLLWRLHASLGRLHSAGGHEKAAENEYLAARALVDELAATLPDPTLKESFLQGAYGALGQPPKTRAHRSRA